MKVAVQPSIDLNAFSIFFFFQLFLPTEVLLQEGSILNSVRGSWIVTLFTGLLHQKWNVFILLLPIIYATFLARSVNPGQCPSYLKYEQWSVMLFFIMKCESKTDVPLKNLAIYHVHGFMVTYHVSFLSISQLVILIKKK